MQNAARNRRAAAAGIALSSYRREELLRAIRERGEAVVCAATGASRSSLARGAAGLGVRPGTLALIEHGLDKLAGREVRR